MASKRRVYPGGEAAPGVPMGGDQQPAQPAGVPLYGSGGVVNPAQNVAAPGPAPIPAYNPIQQGGQFRPTFPVPQAPQPLSSSSNVPPQYSGAPVAAPAPAPFPQPTQFNPYNPQQYNPQPVGPPPPTTLNRSSPVPPPPVTAVAPVAASGAADDHHKRRVYPVDEEGHCILINHTK